MSRNFTNRWIAALTCLLSGCASTPGEPHVDPHINDRWHSSDVDPLVSSLESESREIWVHRQQIADAVGAEPGMSVADVGAGSGFMTELLARAVGPSGRAYAVDINQALLDHIEQKAAADGLGNVRTVLCDQESPNLPPGSVDLVFVCDTYHHFEHPRATLAGLHAALRPGGQLLIVDFEREPGKSRPWVVQHVRAGRETVAREIEAAGFTLVEQVALPELSENYVLRFRRVP